MTVLRDKSNNHQRIIEFQTILFLKTREPDKWWHVKSDLSRLQDNWLTKTFIEILTINWAMRSSTHLIIRWNHNIVKHSNIVDCLVSNWRRGVWCSLLSENLIKFGRGCQKLWIVLESKSGKISILLGLTPVAGPIVDFSY